ncbi:MAG: hypothetical protein Q4E35_00915 [Eubacteriales bacterium]|nr:hypothetical protein [Eubacteriales bacterium]
MDIGSLMKLKQMWGTFCANHPKFPDFLKAVKAKGVVEGTEVTFTVTYPDGQNLRAGLKLRQSDVELIEKLIGNN